MTRAKRNPRRNHVPPAIVQHNSARRRQRIARALAGLFELLSISVRIRFITGAADNPRPLQRVGNVDRARIYGPLSLDNHPSLPAEPATPPMEDLSEEFLTLSENSPTIPYPREIFSDIFSPSIFLER